MPPEYTEPVEESKRVVKGEKPLAGEAIPCGTEKGLFEDRDFSRKGLDRIPV